ncbi:MAG TPA: amidohydrolase family protein [Bryobacteraceae bacterium]|nr:amidohydrolase family protein [Bryobacteraceae bacterium]
MRIRPKSFFALAVLTTVTSFAAAQTLTIAHVNLVDVTDGQVRPDTTVMVEGNRVVSVGPSTAGHPQHGIVVDGRGQYLIPGLWDMHTHVYFDKTAADGTDLVLPLLLVNGVTGVRDMGSELNPVLRAREEIAAHRMAGPRMIVSGPMLDGPKSHYKSAIAIATPEDGRKAVDMLKSRGADFIKIQSGVPREAYFAIADEATKKSIEFEGHVPDAIRASEAVSAGQRSFEHFIGIFEASSPDEDKYLSGKKSPGAFLETYDAVREAAIIQLLAKHGVWQCPTLFWERGQWLVDAIDYTKDPDIGFAARTWVTEQWPATQKSILKSLDTDPLPVREKFVEHELDIIRKLHRAKVPFLAGTDTPAGVDVIPGFSLHLELQRFVAAGFTPLEALQTAALNPAKYYNKLVDYGPVQKGRIADLVLLRANPLDNIANTRTISGVVADGHYMSQADIDQLRGRLRKLAAAK